MLAGLLSALLTLATVEGETGLGRFETPPLPPDAVCGSMPRLDLSDVLLNSATRQADVTAAWGEPRRQGPGGEVAEYYLHCDARLWLSFEPVGERRLTRALLLTGSFVPATRMLFEASAPSRRCDQLPLGRPIRGERVARAWGPPDNEVGSGIVRWSYAMADGGFGQVFPDGDSVRVGCGRGRR